jgi:hypothetical protein
MIAEHPNSLVQEQYLGVIAGRVDIPAEQLKRSIGRRGAKTTITPVVPRPVRARASGPETEALKIAIHRPEAVAGKLHEVLFQDQAHHDAFLALASGAPVTEAIEHAPPDAAALLHRLAVEDVDADPDDVLAGLVRVAVDAAVARQPKTLDSAPTIAWLKQTREHLQDDNLRSEATVALVAWLADEAGPAEEGGTE